MTNQINTRRPVLGSRIQKASKKDQKVQATSLRKAIIRIPAKQKTSLTDLPAEIQLAIFEYLPPVSFTTLGLTCRALYPIYRRAHPVPVKLSARDTKVEAHGFGITGWPMPMPQRSLQRLLQGFMGEGLKWSRTRGKYVQVGWVEEKAKKREEKEKEDVSGHVAGCDCRGCWMVRRAAWGGN